MFQPHEYLLLSVVLVAGILAVARLSAQKPSKKPASPEEHREPTRWKAFRISLEPLHGEPSAESPVIEEVPEGISLYHSKVDPSSRRIPLLDRSGKERVRLTRGLLNGKRLQVSIDRRPFLEVLPGPKGKPPPLDFLEPGIEMRIQGSVSRREYEIRSADRLVAIVSRQDAQASSDPRQDYVVETLKSAKPLPLLAVALALEVAVGPPKG